jgi:hypothetical protein
MASQAPVSITPGEIALRQEVDGAVGDTHSEIADVVLEGVHSRKQHKRAPWVDLRRKVFGEHCWPDDLGIEGRPQVVALQFGQISAGTGRGG